MRPGVLAGTLLVAGASARSNALVERELAARAFLNVDVAGSVCQPVPTTVIVLQPGVIGTVTTTITSTTTIFPGTSTVTATPTITLGEGLPNGTVTDLGQFLFLAYQTPFPIPVAKRDLARRQARVQTTATPITLIDISVPTPGAGLGQRPRNCDNITPLNLTNGALIGDGFSVGKFAGENDAILGYLNDPPPDERHVNRTFSIQDGVLIWNADEEGFARFYSCGDNIYAGFPDLDTDDCVPVIVGPVAGSVCRDFPNSPSGSSTSSSSPFTTTTGTGGVNPSASSTNGNGSGNLSTTSTNGNSDPSSTTSNGSGNLPSASSSGNGNLSSTSSTNGNLSSTSSSNGNPSSGSSSGNGNLSSTSSSGTPSSTSSTNGNLSSTSSTNGNPSSSSSTGNGNPSSTNSSSSNPSSTSSSSNGIPASTSSSSNGTPSSTSSNSPSILPSTGSSGSGNPSATTTTTTNGNSQGSTTTTSGLTTTTTAGQCLIQLPQDCLAIQGLPAGLGLVGQAANCLTAITSPGFQATPNLDLSGVAVAASCLTTGLLNDGTAIFSCLTTNIICGPGGPPATTSGSNGVCLVTVPSACNALSGLGAGLTSGILGAAASCLQAVLSPSFQNQPGIDLAGVGRAVTCLGQGLVQSGNTILTCLQTNLVCTSSSQTTSAPTTTSTTGQCLIQLPPDCLDIQGLGVGLGLVTQAGACLTAITSPAFQATPNLDLTRVGLAVTCLGQGLLQPGNTILTCLQTNLVCISSSSQTTTAPATTSTTGQCLIQLPQDCLDVQGLGAGLGLVTQAAACLTAITSPAFQATPDLDLAGVGTAVTCLTTGLTSSGASILACLQTNIVCGPGGGPATTSASVGTCAITLPGTCAAIGGLPSGLGLVTAAAACLTEILSPSFQGQPGLDLTGLGTAVTCLGQGLSQPGNTILTCLQTNLICTSGTGPSTTSVTTATTSANGGTCAITLPGTCTAISGLPSGLGLVTAAGACLTEILSPSFQGQPGLDLTGLGAAVTCLGQGLLQPGNTILTCLQTNLICTGGASPSTMSATTTSATSTSATTSSTSGTSLLNCIPVTNFAACTSLTGLTGVAAVTQAALCLTGLTTAQTNGGLAAGVVSGLVTALQCVNPVSLATQLLGNPFLPGSGILSCITAAGVISC